MYLMKVDQKRLNSEKFPKDFFYFYSELKKITLKQASLSYKTIIQKIYY